MSDSSEVDLPEECVCPICLNVLVSQVFQCVNGHIVCHKCVKSVTSCPQCRQSYNGAPIRVRVLENMLDRMSFDCKYNKQGCSEKFKRANLSAHHEICLHGGRSVGLCEMLGLPCNIKANTRNLQAVIGHLVCKHQISIEKNLSRFSLLAKEYLGGELCGRRQWNPVIFETAEPNTKVIISFVTTVDTNLTSLEIQAVKARMNAKVLVQQIQLEFKIQVKNEVIVRKIEVDDVEHCDFWGCSQLIKFRGQMANHFSRQGILVECSILLNRESRAPSTATKQIALTYHRFQELPRSTLSLYNNAV